MRFINPAIVTPQAYMLVDGVPAKNPRRTLTLIAKMLQNLANKPTQSKEAYMATLNPFVETNKARMNGFLNSLCEVGDFYDSLEVSRVMTIDVIRKWCKLTLGVATARPIHGFIQEGPADQHHAQRAI